MKDIEGFNQICISAFRYALKSKTYVVSVTIEFLKLNEHLLKKKTILVMLRELKNYKIDMKEETDDYFYKQWMNFAKQLSNYVSKFSQIDNLFIDNYDDMLIRIDELKHTIEELKEENIELRENQKPFNPYEEYGISEKEFY